SPMKRSQCNCRDYILKMGYILLRYGRCPLPAVWLHKRVVPSLTGVPCSNCRNLLMTLLSISQLDMSYKSSPSRGRKMILQRTGYIRRNSTIVQLCILPLILSVFQGNVQAQQLPSKAAPLYKTHEWTLQNQSFRGNPFDLEGKVVFIHTGSGARVATGMFYAGDVSWVFRFTGTRPGDWTFQTYSEDADLDGQTGRVSVTQESGIHANGFITAFGSKWGWQGTGKVFIPQFVMGKAPAAYLTTDGEVNESRITADIREFVEEHGFTGFHIPVMGRWFEGENPDRAVYDVVETLIQRVHARGGACHLWLWGSGGGGADGLGPEAFAEGPMSDIDRRNLRYLAARLGPLPGWSMGYGFDTENGWARPEELDAWKTFLENHMGWDHFLGARVGYDEKGLWAVNPRPPRPPHDGAFRSPIADQYTTWLGGDYTGYTSYRPLYPRYKEVIQHHPEKPSFEEDRFRLRDSEQWSYKDYHPELTRRGLWHSALAGGIANIWGNLLPEDDHGGSQPFEFKAQIKTYSRFFQDRFLKAMKTFYDGPELRLMVPEGGYAIIYREDTEVVRLHIKRLKGAQPAVAVDAKKPYREITIGNFSPGEQTWEAPYRSDWVIAVGKF
ncbi:MAG: DUF5060 domain-containing protein, partial [Candidatus Marinimicrobia bacterium]|nr:DUF5060 domain-containing protein [Candidatus Neomarinimicrobiota bacterium]